MNFREHKIAFVGDIKDMFLPFQVQESDHCAQFEPDVYEIQVLFFGAKCSPSVTEQLRNRNALDFQNDFIVCKDLGEAQDISTAVKLIKDVTYLHKAGGFDIRNCFKSDKRQHFIEKVTEINLTEERVLGLIWDHKKDIFTYNLKSYNSHFELLNNLR